MRHRASVVRSGRRIWRQRLEVNSEVRNTQKKVTTKDTTDHKLQGTNQAEPLPLKFVARTYIGGKIIANKTQKTVIK